MRTLKWLNCSEDFEELIHLALRGNYEVQCHALKVLQTQSFEVGRRQLQSARRKVRRLRPSANLRAEALKLLKADLEAAIDRLERDVPSIAETKRK